MYAIPDFEQRLWELDQRVNDYGVLLDRELVTRAIDCNRCITAKLSAESQGLTGLENTNSVAQVKDWLQGEGLACYSLTKATMADMLETCDDPEIRRVLELRQEMGKSSVAKYAKMQGAVNDGDRIRGLFQYYGAPRTGRWSGNLVQPHNLPQNYLKDLDYARNILKSGDYELLELLYGHVPDTLSQLIRTAFIAPEGHRFIAADFSAIEARVIAWLADEKWRLDVFHGDGRIYEASAAQMFHVPVESITKSSPLRQKGKVAELALGYGGGPGALVRMGALKNGLTEEELPKLVSAWRKASHKIVNLWGAAESAAREAVEEHAITAVKKGVRFSYERPPFGADYVHLGQPILFIELPSGRRLSYQSPRIGKSLRNAWGGDTLQYEGQNQTTRKWELVETYGGKLVENIIQAIARDCLAEAMVRLAGAGYRIVMHIHDEVVIEAPRGGASDIEDVCGIMSEPISWVPGLPLKAAGYETPYYRKD
jgi:DNA polymerase